MNKILLIGINARYSHPSMALYYLREYVRDTAWEVLIREFTIHTPVREILQCVEDERPRAVAFSVYIWNTKLVQDVLTKLAELHDRPAVILGGPDAGYNPDSWFTRFSFINCVVPGHGEQAFRELLDSDLKHVSRVQRAGNPPFKEIPFPYTDDDIRNFWNRKIYYESSRGCLFKCAYCLSSRDDQKLEFRDFSQVRDELAFIMKHKPKIIKFIDRTFNAKKSHSHAVWEHIISTYPDAGTRFHFEVHPALLDDDDFVLLKNSPHNLFQFEIGIQSTCTESLNAVHRRGEWKTIKPKIERLINMNTIHIHIDLIAGLPFEDFDALAFSFNEAYSLNADHFQLGYLKALPGTEVMKRAGEWNLKFASDPPYEISGNRWISTEKIKNIKLMSRLLDMIYNSHRFKTVLENILLFYNSPFNLFEALTDISSRNPVPDSGIQWEYLAGLLAECASVNNKADYILDCLRWDWCTWHGSNRMPKMLKTDNAHLKRKKLLARFRDGWQNPGLPELSETLAARSKLFFPETEDFRIKYTDGKLCVLFPPGKNRSMYFLE